MNEAYQQIASNVQETPSTQKGLKFTRRFSTQGVSPYDDVQWDTRTASITDTKGNSIFEQRDVEVPVDWSMTATNILTSLCRVRIQVRFHRARTWAREDVTLRPSHY